MRSGMRSMEEVADHVARVHTALSRRSEYSAQREARGEADSEVAIENQAYLRGVSDALLWTLGLDDASLEAEDAAFVATEGASALPDDARILLRRAGDIPVDAPTLIHHVRALPFAREGYVLIGCPDAPGVFPQAAWARLIPVGQAKQLVKALTEALGTWTGHSGQKAGAR